jgi:hypothetical protein
MRWRMMDGAKNGIICDVTALTHAHLSARTGDGFTLVAVQAVAEGGSGGV